VVCELAGDAAWHTRLRWLLENLASFAGVRLVFVSDGNSGPGRRLVIGGSPDRFGPETKVLWLPFVGDNPGPQSGSEGRNLRRIPVYGPLPQPDDPAGHRLNTTLAYTSFSVDIPVTSCLRLAWNPLGPAFHELARTAELDPALRTAFHDGRSLATRADSEMPAAPWLEGLADLLFGTVTRAPDAPPTIPRWQGPHNWALCLSHDVDMLFKWRLRSVIRLLLESPGFVLSGHLAHAARQWR
jgi:hypothetical protein